MARSCALSAAVGAPVPPRCLTTPANRLFGVVVGRIKSMPMNDTTYLPLARAASNSILSASACPWCGVAAKPLKMRGVLTTAACSGLRERDLHHFDAEQRRVGILIRRRVDAPGELARASERRRPGDVDVDVVMVVRVDHQRVRVRATARLDGGDRLGMGDVADVVDPDAQQPVRDSPCP